MTVYYAKSTGWFYEDSIHGTKIPSDAVVITDATRQALLAAESAGQVISADANGNPIAIAPPPPTAEQTAALAKFQAQAALDASDRTMSRITEAVIRGATTWTAADVVAWGAYRVALRAIASSGAGALPTRPAFPAGT